MSVDVQQPRAYDLVSNDIQIAGVAGGAFEATFNYRVSEGHDEVTGSFMAGDGAGGHGQFQLSVDVSGASFQLDRVFVEVFRPGLLPSPSAEPARFRQGQPGGRSAASERPRARRTVGAAGGRGLAGIAR